MLPLISVPRGGVMQDLAAPARSSPAGTASVEASSVVAARIREFKCDFISRLQVRVLRRPRWPVTEREGRLGQLAISAEKDQRQITQAIGTGPAHPDGG